MTDIEIKEEVMRECGLLDGRYSFTEENEIKEAMRKYHQAKLNLLTTTVATKVLPKRLSNNAYIHANRKSYAEYLIWWDRQV